MSRISELRERQISTLEGVIEAGASIYDESFGLCSGAWGSNDAKRNKLYGGHWVVWKSPAYAEALLKRKRDEGRAARIIERMCDFVERDPGWPFYGNWYGIAEWGRTKDQNGVCFAVNALGYIWEQHREQLPKKTRAKLYEALLISAEGLVRRRADVFYTNIYLLCIAGKLLLGRILDRPDLLRLAEIEFECLLDRFSRENCSEYNSPTYTPVHIEALITCREFATSPKMRRQADAALDFLLSLFALNYHRPSQSHSGTMSREYREGALAQFESSHHMAHVLFGEPLPAPCGEIPLLNRLFAGVQWTRHDYRPSKAVQDLFDRRPARIRVREQNVSYWGRDYDPRIIERDMHQNEIWSLATQYGVWANYGHYMPFMFTYRNDGRRNLFFQNEPDRPLIDAWFRQTEDRALGAFFWKLHDWQEFKQWFDEPPFRALHIAHLGKPEEMGAFELDGLPWDGKRQPAAGSTLYMRQCEVEIRLRFLKPPKGVSTPAMRMHRVAGDAAIHFTYAESKSADRFWRMPAAMLPVCFEVRRAAPGRPWPETPVTATRDGDVLTLSAKGLTVPVPLTLAGRDRLAAAMKPPIRGNLVESDVLTLDTAALRRSFGLK